MFGGKGFCLHTIIHTAFYLSAVTSISSLKTNVMMSADSRDSKNHSFALDTQSLLRISNSSDCPPPFNCLVQNNTCYNFAQCDEYTRYCACPPGFGNPDCSLPQCGSLAKGNSRSVRPPGKIYCDCDDGWTGVNCNVCTRDNACDPLTFNGANGRCVNSLTPILSKNYVQCDVTNNKIKDALKERKPEIALSCDKNEATCDFQFWAGGSQSFFCHLNSCNFHEAANDKSEITCQNVECQCYPGHILCGQDGTLDLTPWFQDPEEKPRGPASFRCKEKIMDGKVNRDCIFDESHVNDLVATFFDDDTITLSCGFSGECMHSSQGPGNGTNPPPSVGGEYSFMAMLLMVLGITGLVIILGYSSWFVLFKSGDRRGENGGYSSLGSVPVDASGFQVQAEHQQETLLLHHMSCTLMFRDLAYVLDAKRTMHAGAGIAESRSSQDPNSEQVEVDIQDNDVNSPESIGLSLSNRNSAEDVRSPLLPRNASPSKTNKKTNMVVIEGVSGVVRPGQILAIMGGSGAGKTTLLDLLARKNKTGSVYGDILVNGSFMEYQDYKSIIGYVDQEDTLMDTLTVYETILYSALLRLPKQMSLKEKKNRVQETMIELDIVHIANRRIGNSGKRGLSGGEKRRVSIACELVTSPSILFLDEPTSGLDTYSAYNVIECLVSLARNFQRTIVLTIHQPRSNIYALFDQLVLLAKGRVVYSGPAQEKVLDHFAGIGFECPLGFNIADYLVDLTMHAANEIPDDASEQNNPPSVADSFLGLISPSTDNTEVPLSPRRRSAIRTLQEDRLFTRRSTSRNARLLQRKSSLFGKNDSSAGLNTRAAQSSENVSDHLSALLKAKLPDAILIRPEITEQLKELIDAFSNSDVLKSLSQEINDALSTSYPSTDGLNGFDVLERARLRARTSSMVAMSNENWFLQVKEVFSAFFQRNQASIITSQRERAPWWTQFMILSGRTFRNLYRNPNLLLTHYITSIVISVICGFLFWKVDLTLAGFQNRLGAMTFVCAVFGFSCLTSLQVFASERLIFVRERANRYYSPITYFLSKILFDMLPLRIVPPIIFGLIFYFMVGLRPDLMVMLRFLLVLVMFNLTSAAACFAISIIITDDGVANLVATLVMLFQMLFGGLLLNKESIPGSLRWLRNLSFFNFAFEALIVNELKGLTLIQNKFGINITVPANMILDTFGLDPQGYWGDVKSLGVMLAVFLSVAFLWLQFLVKERR